MRFRKLTIFLITVHLSTNFWFMPSAFAAASCVGSTSCGDDSYSQIPFNVQQVRSTDSAGHETTQNYSVLDTSKLTLGSFPPIPLTLELLKNVQTLSPDVVGQIAAQYGISKITELAGGLGQISDLLPLASALGAGSLSMNSIYGLAKNYGLTSAIDGFTGDLGLPSLDQIPLTGQGIAMLAIGKIVQAVPGLSDLPLTASPSIATLASIVGLKDVIPAGLGDISLTSLSSISIGKALSLIPGLENLPLNVLDPTKLVSNFPQVTIDALQKFGIVDLSTINGLIPPEVTDFFTSTGIFPAGFNPLNLSLSNFSVSSIPGLAETVLSKIPGADQLPISSILGLADIPVDQLPIPLILQAGTKLGLVDIVFEKPENSLPQPDRVISGTLPNPSGQLLPSPCTADCSGIEMHQLDGTDYKGFHWLDDSHSGSDGYGLACIPFGCKGPVGNHLYGPAVRLSLTNPSESNGRIQTKLYFHACYDFFGIGLTCTPYNLPPGGIPFISYNEKDTFLFLPPTQKVSGKDANYPSYAPPTCGGSTTANSNILPATPIDPGTLGQIEKSATDVGKSRGYSNAPNSVPLIVKACTEQGITDPGQLAYVLATAQRESSLGAATNEDPSTCFRSDSQGFCGRGNVQITHRDAYLKVGQRLGLGDKLVTNPELANNPQIAAKIACAVFKGGITGDQRSIAQNIPAGSSGQALFDGWYRSRWIINDDDPSKGGTPTDVANSARGYYDAIVSAQNSTPTSSNLAPDPKSSSTPDVKITSICSSPAIPSTDVKPYDSVKTAGGWCDPLPSGLQTSPFGEYPHGGPPPHVHKGIDIAGPANSTIYAAADGIVDDVQTGCSIGDASCGGGFGNFVALRHPNNSNSYTLYGHNDHPLVSRNQAVKCGQPIAIQGTTGSSSGPHSHFQVGTSGAYSGLSSPKSIGIPNMKS